MEADLAAGPDPAVTKSAGQAGEAPSPTSA